MQASAAHYEQSVNLHAEAWAAGIASAAWSFFKPRACPSLLLSCFESSYLLPS